MADCTLDHVYGLIQLAAFIGPPVTEIVQRIGIARVNFDGTEKMCLCSPGFAEPLKRYAKAAV
jgi:hypothetical protein